MYPKDLPHFKKMADVSLDDYIQKKKLTVQIRNVGGANRTGKSGFVKGKIKFTKQVGNSRFKIQKQKNISVQKKTNGQLSLQTKKSPKISLQTRKNKGQFGKLSAKPLTVSVPGLNKNVSGFSKGAFDARDKIAAAKRPKDARDRLAAKAKLSDARAKIQQIKSKQNKNGQVTVTGLGKTLKTINAKVKSSPNFTRTLTNNPTNPQGGVHLSGSSITVTRNVDSSFGTVSTKLKINNQENVSNFKITRTLDNQGNPSGGVQMSAKSMTITRNINNTGYGGTQPQSVSMSNVRGPVIKVTNDQYRVPEDPPLEGYYDEPTGYHYSLPQSKTHVTEKTLTVKYPQALLQQSTQIITAKPPVKPTTVIAVKRKASTQGPLKLASSGPLKLAGGPLSLTKTTMTADPTVIKKPKLVKQEIEEDDLPVQEQIPTLVSSLQGYKILVTNLHPVVSQDDIIELFGAVGPMKKARLVKDGVAEVVYVQKEDAAKAIQKYHNRELDGIPMQVKLTTSKPAPTPKPAVPTTPIEELQPPKISAEPLKLFKGNTKNAPESDIETGTLHRALFKTGVTQPSKLVTFTVKI